MEHMRELRGIGLAVALLGALLLPGGARAATVHVGPTPAPLYPCCGHGSGGEAVYYVADPGESNRVTLSSDLSPNGFNGVTVHDPGAVIHAGASCESIDEHTATCSGTRSGLDVTEAHLGDGADELHVSEAGRFAPTVNAFGGPGDDILVGGPHRDQLDGGGGHDMLFGGDDTDVLTDGDLSGAPGDAGPGPDLMDGGAGQDFVSYEQRTAPVTVDLGSGAPAGEPGDGDALRNVEGVYGGSAGDRLTGSSADNELRGRDGPDVLTGLGGADTLFGGAGRDRLVAGDGDDQLLPGPGVDALSCGLGSDRVTSPSAGEVIGRCELVVFENLGPGPDVAPGLSLDTLELPPHPFSTSQTALTFLVSCPDFDQDDGSPRPCAGTLKVREAFGRRRLLGRLVRLPDRRRKGAAVRVRLNSLGRRLIRRRGGVFATVVLGSAPSAGHSLPDAAWTIRLAR
jgi:Ca2+-binding RTX toxin-like protein